MASVLSQLKKFAGPSEGTTDSQESFGRDFLPSAQASVQQGQMDSMFQDHPIPGQSLTQDPDSKLPFEGPPRFTEQQEFIEHLFIQLTDSNVLPNLLQSMRKKVPVEIVALKVLRSQVKKGNINTDLMLLSIEPTIYTLISLATLAEIDPVLYPEEDFDADGANSEMASRFRTAAQEMATGGTPDEDPKLTVNDLQAPPGLPRSLMDRAEKAVEEVS